MTLLFCVQCRGGAPLRLGSLLQCCAHCRSSL